MSEAAARSAIIVGGSMAGLFTGLLLRRAGVDVHVYERAGEELANRGAGIVTHPPLFDALEQGGARVSGEMGVRALGRRVFARDGSIEGEVELPQTLTSWGLMYRALLEAFPPERYHNGHSLESLECEPDGVVAHFSNGKRARAAWLIGADGVRSTVRGLVAPEIQHDYAGYVAWRGLVDEAALPESVLAELRDYLSFSLPSGEQMLGYLVAGPGENLSPGQRTFNWVWYRPAHPDDTLADLLTDTAGTRHEMSIPPDRIRQPVIDGLREAANHSLSPQYRKVVELTSQPFIQPIYDLASPRLVHGRVLILGDAAFVARPHVGMGVTKAALDAVALARAFGMSDIDAALVDWERERLDFGHAVVTRARELGAYLQAQLLTTAEREQAERNRSAEVVMRETASPLGL